MYIVSAALRAKSASQLQEKSCAGEMFFDDMCYLPSVQLDSEDHSESHQRTELQSTEAACSTPKAWSQELIHSDHSDNKLIRPEHASRQSSAMIPMKSGQFTQIQFPYRGEERARFQHVEGMAAKRCRL